MATKAARQLRMKEDARPSVRVRLSPEALAALGQEIDAREGELVGKAER